MEQKPDYLPVEFLGRMAEAIKLLGHPQRLQIVDVLDLEGELSAGRIGELCKMTQSQTSQHLSQMRRLGLVECRREGTQMFYKITGIQPRTIIGCIRGRFAELNAPLAVKKYPLKRR